MADCCLSIPRINHKYKNGTFFTLMETSAGKNTVPSVYDLPVLAEQPQATTAPNRGLQCLTQKIPFILITIPVKLAKHFVALLQVEPESLKLIGV